jgi:hypothetical protein
MFKAFLLSGKLPDFPWEGRLNPFKTEIIALLNNGAKKNFTALHYGIAPPD